MHMLAEPQNGNGNHPGGGRTAKAPANVECEQNVLAAVMRDNSAMHEVAQVITAEDFFRAAHATIYRAIQALYDAGKAFDPGLVCEQLERSGEFEAVGGDEYVIQLFDRGGWTAVNAVEYAQVVRRHSIARQLIQAGTETLEEGYSTAHGVEELLAAAERRIFEIASRQIRSSTKDGSAMGDLAMARLEARRHRKMDGIGSGFAALDDKTDGFRPANLVILAARPSQGKTALAMNICEHIAIRQGVPTLFVSLEMEAGELSDRLIASQSGVSAQCLKTPKTLLRADWDAITDAHARIAAAPLFIEDAPSRTIAQLGALMRLHKARNGVAFVAIDYLSLIDGQGKKGESRQEEVARVSRQLKGLARELKLPVLVLHQLNRQSEHREDRRPRLADLRESGQIEQDADLVMLLHRPEQYEPKDRPGEADILVAKNRCGQTGQVQLAFVKELTKFGNTANQNHVHDWEGH